MEATVIPIWMAFIKMENPAPRRQTLNSADTSEAFFQWYPPFAVLKRAIAFKAARN
jgi:hypothetical protein